MLARRNSAAVILNEKQQVLLQLRDLKKEISWPGVWSLPGGRRRFFETSIMAVKREVLEETNLVLRKPKFIGTFFDDFEKRPIMVDIFTIKIQNYSEMKLGEGRELRFFSREEIENIQRYVFLDCIIDLAMKSINATSGKTLKRKKVE